MPRVNKPAGPACVRTDTYGAQSSPASRMEIGIDFCLSVAVNLMVQAFFLRSFTLGRGVSFSAVFLTCAPVRRYLVRRGFNRFVLASHGQTRGMSFLEVLTDTVLAVVVAFGLVALCYPSDPTPKVTALIVTSYLLTMVRRFALRRFFEWLYCTKAIPEA